MIAVKERSITPGQLVEVYYNLHKHVFSIRDKKTKLVLAHTERVHLKNVTFKVSQKGREKTVETKQKRVHAFVVGEFMGTEHIVETNPLKNAYYNPYRTETFIDTDTKKPLTNVAYAVCDKKRVYYTE